MTDVTTFDQTTSSFYQHEAEYLLSEHAELRRIRQQGLATWQRLGFPARRDEDWRYTSVAGFLKHTFRTAKANGVPQHAQLIASKQTDVPWGHKLVMVDGIPVGLDALRKHLPPGVIVMPILEALQTTPDKITPYLDQILQPQHGFHAQNSAMLRDGMFIYVPAHVAVVEPLLLVHWQTQAEQAVYLRHMVVLESGAQFTLIEDYQGLPDLSYYTNTITEASVSSKAYLKHYKLQRESHAAWHVGHVAMSLAAGSQADSHALSLGALWSRFDACYWLREPQARCFLNGIYAARGQQHMDHHTWVYHQSPHGTSRQDYKGIVHDAAHAVFNGQVHVAPHAQKTVAQQQNKNLLLSKHAEVDTKPQLDIAADDVQCTHGATVGQLDHEALFYFATRGIGIQEATMYLIQGFVAENLQTLGCDRFATWLQSQMLLGAS